VIRRFSKSVLETTDFQTSSGSQDRFSERHQSAVLTRQLRKLLANMIAQVCIRCSSEAIMSFWFFSRRENGHRSLISVGVPITLLTLILAMIFALVRC
jgi:hypothetical protein